MPLGLSALNIHLHISLGFCILRHWETVHVVSNVRVPQCLVILIIKNFISRHKIQPRKPYLNKQLRGPCIASKLIIFPLPHQQYLQFLFAIRETPLCLICITMPCHSVVIDSFNLCHRPAAVLLHGWSWHKLGTMFRWMILILMYDLFCVSSVGLTWLI